MADYIVRDTQLTTVADAIRAKGGTSEKLAFPEGFVSAVEGISAGGGGSSEIVLPDTAGRVYMTLAPSDIEEILVVYVQGSGGYEQHLVASIGIVEDNTFIGQKELSPSSFDGPNYTFLIPPHSEIMVLEFKHVGEHQGDTLNSFAFDSLCSPVILELKINTAINIRPDTSQITRSVRKWTLNADSDPTLTQSYLAFQFAGCDEIDLSRVAWPAMTTVYSMFLNSACRRIVIPNLLPEGSTANSLLQMFDGCANLREIVGLDTWNLSGVKNIKWAFRYCQNLIELDLSSWGKYSSGFTNIDGFNRWCAHLKTINLSSWNVGHLTAVYDVFDGCTDLENIVMDGTTWVASNFNLSRCQKLTVESLNAVIAALPEAAKTLTLGATNMAKLTDEQIAVATEKGWTVA